MGMDIYFVVHNLQNSGALHKNTFLQLFELLSLSQTKSSCLTYGSDIIKFFDLS